MDSKQQLPAQLEQSFKLYKMRWVVLVVSVFTCASGNMQWMQYGIIGDVLVLYYGISFDAVNWTSMVFLLMYIIFLFPVSYILDKYGVRVSLIVGIVGTAIGAWIKVLSASPDRFWVLLVGQTFVAIGTSTFLALPAKLAAVWFGANEVSSACGFALAGVQMGFAVGYAVPPLLIRNQYDRSLIEGDLFTMSLCVAITCTVLVIVVLICCPDKPETPPSYAAMCCQDQRITFFEPLKKLVANRAYLLIVVGFGIDLGVSGAVSALLNQIVLAYYPEGFLDAGRIGLLAVTTGIFGSIICGIVLDRYKCYKEALLTLQLMTILTMILFTVTFKMHIISVYVSMGLLGFYLGAQWALSFEIVAEITFPEPEGIAVALLNGFGQALAIPLTYLYSTLFYQANVVWANTAITILANVAFVAMLCMPMELRRKAANLKEKEQKSVHCN
uniref:Major facilitator superfamily (MFS) profile domain-containing protein n=1 Tax=Photinus pyralis TaxID=7054 RepID=A0A1Y1M1X7_PHOPY